MLRGADGGRRIAIPQRGGITECGPGTGRVPDDLRARHRRAGPRSVVAADVRHAHFAHDRSAGRDHEPGAGRAAGRALRLLRRRGRHDHPARHRDPPLDPHDPPLDGPGRRVAARVDRAPGLLRHHHHHLAAGLDRAGARGARPLPGHARGGLRGLRAARGLHAAAYDLRPHGAVVHEPHHRGDHAGPARDDHQRDRPQLPGPGPASPRDQLGRAPAAGPERPDGGDLPVAHASRGAGDRRGDGLQLPG